jgi:hypothetical protein
MTRLDSWRHAMKKALRSGVSYIYNNLGACTYCMRKAFLGAALAWSLVILAAIVNSPSVLFPATVLTAATLTGLYLTHLFVFATKASAVEYRRKGAYGGQKSEGMSEITRRGVLPLFAQALTFAAIATTIPMLGWAGQDYSTCNSNCYNASLRCWSQCGRMDSGCQSSCDDTRARCQRNCCSLLPSSITVPGC